MPKITYHFGDGTNSEVEVDDELYTQYLLIEKQQDLVDRRETRRHKSLNAQLDARTQFLSGELDPLIAIIQKEEDFLNFLSVSERELFESVYIDNRNMAEIAREQNLAHTTIKTKIYRIIEKIKNKLKSM